MNVQVTRPRQAEQATYSHSPRDLEQADPTPMAGYSRQRPTASTNSVNPAHKGAPAGDSLAPRWKTAEGPKRQDKHWKRSPRNTPLAWENNMHPKHGIAAVQD